MSYTTVKDNLVSIMTALGYQESKEPFDIEDMSSQKLDKTFIVSAISGALDEGEEGETLVDRFYDDQIWEIKLAFKKSTQNQVINRDIMHTKRVAIITDLDNPSKWLSTVRIQKYQSWIVEEAENYFLLTITVKIIDVVTY